MRMFGPWNENRVTTPADANHCSHLLVGTEMSITQSGIPEAIPLEMCYLGWQESLAQLATLVEPDITS